jgi:hypothetical protein
MPRKSETQKLYEAVIAFEGDSRRQAEGRRATRQLPPATEGVQAPRTCEADAGYRREGKQAIRRREDSGRSS